MKNTNATKTTSINTIFRRQLPLVTAIALVGASGLVHAQAESKSRNILSGSDAVSLSISGQINRAALIVDDGEDTTLLNVDNNASSSRIRFIAASNNKGPWSAGAALESEFRLNNSYTIDQTEEGQDDVTAIRHRRLEVYFANKDLGKVWLGQGWTASEGVSENDLSGTAIAGYSEVNTTSGGILFRNEATGELSSVALRNVSNNLDGLGRNTRLRYDTPSVNGFQLRTSVINQGGVDAALFYDGSTERLKIAAGVAWANTNEANGGLRTPNQVDDQVSGSVSVLDSSGVSVTAAYGIGNKVDSSIEDVTFMYTKLGYQTNLVSVGKTYFSVDYAQTEDLAQADDRAQVYGVQALQKITDLGTDLYAGLRNLSLDRTGVEYEDNLVAIVGARVTF